MREVGVEVKEDVPERGFDLSPFLFQNLGAVQTEKNRAISFFYKMEGNAEKTAGADPKMLQNKEGLFLLLVVFCELVVVLYLICDHRMSRGHDGFCYHYLQYYFLNNAVTAGEFPQWMPFLTHGVVGHWWHFFSGAMTQNVLLLAGGFLKGVNFLPIFHLGMFFDELLLLIGVWLLTGRWFASPLTRCFTTATALGSTIWMSQPYLNFRFFYVVPLILHFLHLFFDGGKWRHAFLAANLLAIQLLGGGVYSFPVVSMVIFAYFFAHGLLFYPESREKIRAIRWNWSGAGWIALSVMSFFLVYLFKVVGTDGIILYSSRKSDHSVSLDTFLTYGGKITLEQWGEQLFLGAANPLDYSLYCGVFFVPFLILGMICNPRREALVVMAVAMLLIFFSLGGLVSILCYHLWPMMKYYRHIALVAPLTKLFLCFLAGFGFEALAARCPPVHVLRVSRAGLIAGGSALLLGILIRKDEILRFLMVDTSGVWIALILLLLSASAPIRGNVRSVIAFLVLAWHLLDLYSYKIGMVSLKTLSLNDAQYKVNAFTPMPYARRRDLDYFSNPRAAVFKTDLLEAGYGGRYAVMNSYFFQDTSGSSYRVDYWLQPLDDFMRTYWRQPIRRTEIPPAGLKDRENPNCLDFPTNHVASMKFAGITEDKIQVFSDAHSLDSDHRLAGLMVSSNYAGDILFVSTPDRETKFPTPPRRNSHLTAAGWPGKTGDPSSWQDGASLRSNKRLPVRYEVQRFDANHLEVAVEVDRQSVDRDGAWLFYSDVWHPFWKATVNGEPVEVFKANLAYKAVPIGPGKNVVRFWFHSGLLSFLFVVFGINSIFWVVFILWLVWQNIGFHFTVSGLVGIIGKTTKKEQLDDSPVSRWR